jgi:sugar transferase (PEP-CTERM system associated)
MFDQKIIVIGSDELAHKIMNEISGRTDCGYKIACIVLERYYQHTIEDARSPIIWKKNYKGLCELAKQLKIKIIVVAIKEKRGEFPTDELLKCRVQGIDVFEGNSFFEMLTGKLIVQQINPSWLIFSEGFQKSRSRRFVKRTIDIILSTVLLIMFLPFIVLLAILIKIDSIGPVFYSQERIGEHRKKYRIFKFRSMVDDAEKECGPVCTRENDERITRIGRLIRKLRIDEVPQLWNVLKGDMSFVGPRPERDFFVKQYEKKIPYYGERFSVRPGVTGWAQVCYQYSTSLDDTIEKLNYDLFYIKNMSAFLDLMIVLRTIKIVLFGRGAR